MKKSMAFILLVISVMMVFLSACSEPKNSANGDPLVPEGVKITDKF